MSNLPQEDYDYAEVIGRNLQRLINERGTTQAAIAQKLGIARSGINKYVQGVSSPSPRNIMRICSPAFSFCMVISKLLML